MLERLKRRMEELLERMEAPGRAAAGYEVDDVLAGMRDELIEARAETAKLSADLSSIEARLAAERRKLEDCRRRARLAEGIEDQETHRIARDFEARHRARCDTLEEKLRSGREELERRTAETEQMTRQLKAAVAQRDQLAVRLQRTGRSRGGARLTGADLLEEFQRLESRIGDAAELEDARRELDEELGERGAPPAPPADPEGEAERRLRELKRELGAEEEG